MTKLLTALFNALIEESYSFSSIKECNNYRRYRLVNEKTSCAVMVTEEGIDISLCLLEHVADKSYDSERRVSINCAEDLLEARELIRNFEYLCYGVNTQMNPCYMVTVIYHSYSDEIHGRAGTMKPVAIFASLEEAETFIKDAPDYDEETDCELYYRVYPVIKGGRIR